MHEEEMIGGSNDCFYREEKREKSKEGCGGGLISADESETGRRYGLYILYSGVEPGKPLQGAGRSAKQLIPKGREKWHTFH